MLADIKILFLKVCGGFFALHFFLSSAFAARGDSGIFHDFKLKTCSSHNCYAIESKDASQSFLASGYAFEFAKIQIYDLHGKKIEALNSGDVFYDDVEQKIYMHKIVGRPHSEMMLDVETGKLLEFKKM